ncbi:MAG: Eco57I restriction-modification methylase domain-containing protein [Candidatus Hodarchaeales archaeon]|jgi:hypothetical protein
MKQKEIFINFYLKYQKIHNELIMNINARFSEKIKIKFDMDNIKRFISLILDRILFLGFLRKIEGFPEDIFIIDNRSNHFHEIMIPVLFWLNYSHKFGESIEFNGISEANVVILGTIFRNLPFLNCNIFRRIPIEEELYKLKYSNNKLTVNPYLVIFTNQEMKKIYQLMGLMTCETTTDFLLVPEEFSSIEGINPEILGFIYEQGLDQNVTGAFYTPKSVTTKMARSSIMNWIWKNLSVKSRDLITSLEDTLKINSHPIEGALTLEKIIYNFHGYKNSNLDLTINEILSLIEKIKVLDPTCGAGALLLAIFNELTIIWKNLSIQADSIEIYNQGLNFIKNNLFGVDILPEAIEKTILRLELAITSFCSSIKDLKPFLNTDFNFFIGNSIIGRSHLINQNTEIDKDKIYVKGKEAELFIIEIALISSSKILASLCSSAIDEISRKKKINEIIPAKIIEMEEDIRKSTLDSKKWDILFNFLEIPFSFFDPLSDLDDDKKDLIIKIVKSLSGFHSTDEKHVLMVIYRFFLEMNPFNWLQYFNSGRFPKNKFDIIIGNPPYEGARKESTRKGKFSWFNLIEREFIKIMASEGYYNDLEGAWDLALPFVENAFNLANLDSIICMILPRSFGTHDYSSRIFDKIAENGYTLELSYFKKQLYLFKQINSNNGKLVSVGIENLILLSELKDSSNGHFYVREYQDQYLTLDKALFEIRTPKNGFGPVQNNSLKGIELKNFCSVVKGIKATSKADDPQFRGKFKKDDLLSNNLDALHSMPFFERNHIGYWNLLSNQYIEWGSERCPNHIHRPRHDSFFEGNILVTPLSASKPKWAIVNEKRIFRTSELIVMFKLWFEWNLIENSDLANESSIRRLLYNLVPKKERNYQNLPKICNDVNNLSSYLTSNGLLGFLQSNIIQNYRLTNPRSFGKFEVGQWEKIKFPFLYPFEIKIIDEIISLIIGKTDELNNLIQLKTDIDPTLYSKYFYDIYFQMWKFPPDDLFEIPESFLRLLNNPEEVSKKINRYYDDIWKIEKGLILQKDRINIIIEKAYERIEVDHFWKLVRILSQDNRNQILNRIYDIIYHDDAINDLIDQFSVNFDPDLRLKGDLFGRMVLDKTMIDKLKLTIYSIKNQDQTYKINTSNVEKLIIDLAEWSILQK